MIAIKSVVEMPAEGELGEKGLGPAGSDTLPM